MALIERENTDIEVEISDKVIGDTRVKRKVVVEWEKYSPHYKRTMIDLLVQIYAVATDPDTGEEIYGEYIGGQNRGFSDYRHSIVAHTDQFVDPVTGTMIGTRIEYEDPANSEEGGKFYNIDFIPEFDFFKGIAESVPVILDQMIIQYIQQADAEGKI